MLQGILCNNRIGLLLKKCHKNFNPKRKGHKKRKNVRGCIVGPDIKMLHLIILKKGVNDLPGITDGNEPRRLGPKRANRIRRLYGAERGADVTKLVIRRPIIKNDRTHYKAPKI